MSFKKCRLVMLSSNEKANIFERKGNRGIALISKDTKIDSSINYLNLYILSDEEIKEGDYIYENNLNLETSIYQIYRRSNRLCFFRFRNVPIWLDKKQHTAKKIIATTDSNLWSKERVDSSTHLNAPLPQPSQAFVEKYITEYNKGNIIEDVLVEYECLMSHKLVEIDLSNTNKEVKDLSESRCVEDRLKISSGNTISIKKVKDSWSKEEVEQLLHLALATGSAYGDKMDQENADSWIKNNL